MFRSATVKLTVWYICLVMAISLLFSVVVYNIGTNEIARSVRLQSEGFYYHYPALDNGRSLNADSYISDSDHDLLIRLIFLNFIVLIIAGLVSYWLARLTLEPIEEIHLQQKRFTSDVSHELRTPLTALKMESEVALMNPKISPKELKATLQSNLEEAIKLERLINNILRLTRLETSELKQSFALVDTQAVIQAAIKQVDQLAKTRNIQIKQSTIKQQINGDRDSLTQMLVILLDNAIKYSGTSTEVSIESAVADNNLNISVIDRGIGVPKDALDHIFDRFYRAEGSRAKDDSEEGYGLGLSIAKMIADLHDATITVTSQVSKGTTVKLSLPLAKSN